MVSVCTQRWQIPKDNQPGYSTAHTRGASLSHRYKHFIVLKLYDYVENITFET